MMYCTYILDEEDARTISVKKQYRHSPCIFLLRIYIIYLLYVIYFYIYDFVLAHMKIKKKNF